MKNVLNQAPATDLHGRLLFSAQFVDIKDLVGKEVLDVGCGFGSFAIYALKRGASKIVGTEVSEHDLATARKHLKDQRAAFVIGNAIQLPFPDASFDTVVSWEVLEHIPKKREPNMFGEVRRVLKTGGAFYLSTPNASLVPIIFDPAWWLVGHRHYSVRSLRSFGASAGLDLVRYDVRGKNWTILGWLNMYFSKWILRRRPVFEAFFHRKEDEEWADRGYVNIFCKFVKG